MKSEPILPLIRRDADSRAAEPQLSVVIVSYRCARVLSECLQSLYRSAKAPEVEVIVVDNASADGTAELMSSAFPHVTFIENAQNVGFPAANNQGIVSSRAESILLLNPDTVVYDGAIERLIECFASEPKNKIVGLNVRNVDGSAQNTVHLVRPAAIDFVAEQSGVLRRHVPVWDRDAAERASPETELRSVGWVSGAALAFTKSIVERVGMLDEDMFWAEDLDFCARAAEAGIPILYLSSAKVMHYGGESGKRNFRKMIFHQHFSRVAFARKHYGLRYELLLRAIYSLTLPAKILLRLLQLPLPGRAIESRQRLAGYIDALAFCVYTPIRLDARY